MNGAQDVKNHLSNLSDEKLKEVLTEYRALHEGGYLPSPSCYKELVEYICRKVGVQYNLQIGDAFIFDELVMRYLTER